MTAATTEAGTETFGTEASALASQCDPVVSIVVVSYNTREMTLECLHSVFGETRTRFELIVIDNASSDGSAAAIAAEFPGIRLLAESQNHGFAKANNIAAYHARGEYLLLLNPDTVVLEGAIDRLVDFAQRVPQARIWGGRTMFGDRSLNPSNCWGRMTVWSVTSQALGLSSLFRRSKIFNPEGYGGWLRDSEREVDIVTGCLLLIRRKFWEELGGFDPSFVMYGEEADLCLRARSRGARPRITPQAQIVHYAGASEMVRSDKMVRLLRAKLLLIRRHFPIWQRPIGLLLFRLWPLSRFWGTRLLRRRDAAEMWSNVWRRRSEWWHGWPDINTEPLLESEFEHTTRAIKLTTQARYMLVKAKGGFGNRILSAITGTLLAEVTGRVAVIDWRDGEYLDRGVNAYPLLFEDPVGVDVAKFDNRSDVTPAIWAGHLSEHPTDLIERFFPNDHSNPFIYRKLSIDLAHPSADTDLAVFWSYLPKMARIRRQVRALPAYREFSAGEITRRALSRYFTPNDRVRERVDELLRAKSRPIIGVHIRHTDRKVPLARIAAEVARLRKRMPYAPIFLATDNQRVQDDFGTRFDNVIVIEKTLGDDVNSLHEHVVHADPLREAENALVDMWALASCDWLVHSRHSTFSVAAAAIGAIPHSRQRDVDRRNPRVVLKRWLQTWA
ncbi:glycosyltransferase [Pseudaminobacter sp. 19-2017]|uniref:Glycosyltransferase n=1 Tax=Pseudaminobacter soli (ex Zhang et al. 2022) TaxID=2831468 RepID=A0A942E6N0_9HYPH|nr:nodulation protein NodZ [Pseudaminobacter soli]MBS3649422.1 glycosyltransferase [Pseudaminobacter soli]